MSTNFAPTCVKREKPKTPEQCAQIAMAEFLYWRNQDEANIGGEMSMGAIAAAANIYAAISHGLMAPWHPGGSEAEKEKNDGDGAPSCE